MDITVTKAIQHTEDTKIINEIMDFISISVVKANMDTMDITIIKSSSTTHNSLNPLHTTYFKVIKAIINITGHHGYHIKALIGTRDITNINSIIDTKSPQTSLSSRPSSRYCKI
jgi:hypothetical protein